MKRGLTGSTLKIIAMVTMLIDHIGAAVLARLIIGDGADIYEIYRICRLIGRVAFPIFCFLLVEGFLHTSNAKKYAVRLFAFALVSEIPFDLAFSSKVLEFEYQNVFFTLAIGFMTMMVYKKLEEKIFVNQLWKTIMQIGVGLIGGCIAELLHTDYGMMGVLVIALFYILRDNRVCQIAAGAVLFFENVTALFAFLPIWMYNGERGMKVKWVFYAFYPVHLLLLYGISYVLGVGAVTVV